MKKILAAAICLTLCLLSASCSLKGSDATSPVTEESTSAAASLTTETQAEPTTEQTVEETVPEQSTQQTTTQTQPTTASGDIQISDLPMEFVFSSGAGGWDTTLTIRPDGTFDGIYHDSDYMQLYYSTFNGKLGQPKKTGEHTYLVKIEEFHVTNDQDKVFYDDSVEYIPSDPYGLENTNELILYTPGMPISDMPEDCQSWLMFYEKENSVLADGDYVLYNAQEGDAFIGLH